MSKNACTSLNRTVTNMASSVADNTDHSGTDGLQSTSSASNDVQAHVLDNTRDSRDSEMTDVQPIDESAASNS